MLQNEPELVVLVDEMDREIGTMPKSTVHSDQTPLHRAFSSFIFNTKGMLMLQQRSSLKKTWPLVWSNSCCGHPLPNEERISAVKRRLEFELGIDQLDILQEIAPYRYCFTRYGVMENEICPIFVGVTDQIPKINPEEVEQIQWLSWPEFLKEIELNQDNKWSEWCIEEARILDANAHFKEILQSLIS